MSKINQTKKKITIDGLARIVQGGFLSVEGRLDKIETNIKEVKSDIYAVKSDIHAVKSDTEDIKANLNKKVDKIDHNTLEYRVEKLEKKFA
jgi:archaellum component FlaC